MNDELQYPFENQNKIEKPNRLQADKYKNLSPTDFQQQREIDWLMYEAKSLRHYCDNNAIKHKKFVSEIRSVIKMLVWGIVGGVLSIILWTVVEPKVKAWVSDGKEKAL